MARVVRSTPANEDLIAIWEYVAHDSPNAATLLLQRIDRAFHLLAENPDLGERQSQLSPEMRLFVVNRYAVFYEPIPDGIQIVRVLHGARKHDDLF